MAPGQSPVRDGGLGVRRVSSFAIPAFLASAASTLSLQDDILSDCAKSGSDFLQSYLSAWTLKFGDVPDELPTKQPFWPNLPRCDCIYCRTIITIMHRVGGPKET